jgi:hypothetical protein
MFNTADLIKDARADEATHKEDLAKMETTVRDGINKILVRKQPQIIGECKKQIKAFVRDKKSTIDEIYILIIRGDCGYARLLGSGHFSQVFKEVFTESKIGKALQDEGWIIGDVHGDENNVSVVCKAHADLHKTIMEARASWSS